MPKFINKSCVKCDHFWTNESIRRCVLCAQVDQWTPRVVDKLDTALAKPLKECKGIARDGSLGFAEECLLNSGVGTRVQAFMYFPLQEARV